MTTASELLRVVNSSGFPLQIALQNAVETVAPGWKVQHREHAWAHPTNGQSGFIDLVVQSETYDSIVVECKRVQDSAWLFLSHGGSAKHEALFKPWITKYQTSQPSYFGWADLRIPLQTPQAQFCCVRGQSSNDKNTFLERLATELVSATEALAVEEREYRNSTRDSCRLYCSVIVTTAKLHFATFDLSALRLEDGTLEHAEFQQVPYLRVRKQFARTETPLTLDDWSRNVDTDIAREHTVFVVEASQFTEFLKDLQIDKVAVSHVGA